MIFSKIESERVRKCIILFYLTDGSMEVTEEKVLNSGIEGGAFLKRAHMPNEDKGGRTFLKEDLKVGGEVTIFGRKFHIYDCDGFTRDCVNEINQR